MARVFANVADDELDTGISAGATSSTLVDASEFPATGDFSIRFEDASNPAVFEIVTATARSGNVITHAATASAWDAGDKVYQVVAKADLDEFLQETAAAATYQALSEKGAASGYASLNAAARLTAAQRPEAVGARVYRTTDQTLANNTDVPINFDNEDYDTSAFHDNTTNNTRLICALAGKYRVTGQLRFVANATGQRTVNIRKNGTDELGATRVDATAAVQTMIQVVAEFNAAANDYIELIGSQNSGGNLDVDGLTGANIGLGCWFAISYLGA